MKNGFKICFLAVIGLCIALSSFKAKEDLKIKSPLYWYSSPISQDLIRYKEIADEIETLNSDDPGHVYGSAQTSGGIAFEFGYASQYPHTGQNPTIIYQDPIAK